MESISVCQNCVYQRPGRFEFFTGYSLIGCNCGICGKTRDLAMVRYKTSQPHDCKSPRPFPHLGA